jgi:type I restriction enzyme, R subunit
MRALLEVVPVADEVHSVEDLALSKTGDFLKVKTAAPTGAKRALADIPTIKQAFMGIQAHIYAQ